MKASIACGRTLLALTGFAWICLICSQFGLPLDMSSEQARRFETPITPAGYAFAVIWTVIFVLQGVGAFLPWAGNKAPWAAVCLSATGWPWICSWTLEALWTLTQFLLQRYRPGTEPWAVLLLCAGFLLGGHVAMGVAMRRALVAVQRLQAQGTGTWPMISASVLYLLSSGLNCGWLALATCLGVLDLAVSCGASYDDLLPWSLALLFVAACSLAFQPWLWGIELCSPPLDKAGVDPGLPASLARSGGYTAPALTPSGAGGDAPEADADAGADTGSCTSPLVGSAGLSSAAPSCSSPCKGRLGPDREADAERGVGPFLLAVSAYSAALAWGFVGIAAAERPLAARAAAMGSLAAGLLGLAAWSKFWLQRKLRA